MWQAWRKVWEVKEILDDAKKSLMNKIDQQEKVPDKINPILWIKHSHSKDASEMWILNLRTKLNVMTTPKKASWKGMIYENFFKDSSDSETHSLKRKSNRQNQPDSIPFHFIQLSNQHYGFQMTEGYIGATGTVLAHKGLLKTTWGVEKATLFIHLSLIHISEPTRPY